MTDHVRHLLERYRSQGVLVDTNILLLYFVGNFSRQQIPRFKRTLQFTEDDYDRLTGLLTPFDKIVTTPHILSEVNSLSGQLGEPARTRFFEEFARGITTLDEQYVASAEAAQLDKFPKLGLTDSGIMHLAAKPYLVLTDDFKLYQFLEQAGIDVLNFSHLRFID